MLPTENGERFVAGMPLIGRLISVLQAARRVTQVGGLFLKEIKAAKADSDHTSPCVCFAAMLGSAVNGELLQPSAFMLRFLPQRPRGTARARAQLSEVRCATVRGSRVRASQLHDRE